MSRARISIDTLGDLEQAEVTLHELWAADAETPGWLNDELGLSKMIERLEKAIDRYHKLVGDEY